MTQAPAAGKTSGAGGPRPRLGLSAGAAVLATAAQALQGLVLYAFLIRSAGAEAVGLWVSLMAAGLLACMADLGLNHVLIRRLPLVARDPQRASAVELLETLVWAVAGFTGLALLAVWLLFPAWSLLLSLAPAQAADAARWLPWLLLGLWLNRVGDALAGGLDGQLRFVERSAAGIATLALGLGLSVAWVPHWGLDGAAVAFVVQNAALLLANAWLVKRGTPGLRLLRPRWRGDVLRASAAFGLSVQGLVMSYLVLESGAKLLLAGAGQLGAVSYFDLAFRLGKGVRGLLASAMRVLVPRLAATQGQAQGQQRREQAYALSFGLQSVVATTVFAGLLAASQALSWAVLGRAEPGFVAALAVTLSAWLAYALTDPALNLALASGRMRGPLRGHLLTLALFACLATFVAMQDATTSSMGLYGGVGCAMLVGSIVTLVGTHADEGMPCSLLRPARTLGCVAAGLAVGQLGAMAPQWLTASSATGRWGWVALGFAAFIGLFVAPHPSTRWLLAFVRAGRRPAHAEPELVRRQPR